jgi:hypothetical protein
MFEPFLLDFFVNSTDAAFIRKLKLGILTCIASETNISTILEELNVRCLRSSVPSVLSDMFSYSPRCIEKTGSWSRPRSRPLADARRASPRWPTAACALS